MINTVDAPSQTSADATAPFAPKARVNPNQSAKIRCRSLDNSVKFFMIFYEVLPNSKTAPIAHIGDIYDGLALEPVSDT